MRPLFCSPGETVMGEGNQGSEMFFLIKGKVEVLHQGHTVNCYIRVGEVREGRGRVSTLARLRCMCIHMDMHMLMHIAAHACP